MSMSLLKYEGSCSCGRVKVGLLNEPMLKYNCHCSNCRKFAGHNKPFHSGAMCWRWSVLEIMSVDGDVENSSNDIIEYEYTTGLFGLFGLARGRCRHCKDCILEKGRRLAAPYSMVMAPPLKDLEPDTDIFYNSGVLVQQEKQSQSQTSDDRRTTTATTTTTTSSSRVLYTDFESVLFEIYTVLTSGLVSLPGSLLSRVMYWYKFRSNKAPTVT
mmetsp:Transcript_57859/g.141363  ORF Transcript_57859/g.141363 Transcript_57859/m.141363 type:complete len:214 (+) Transcript_57859:200-841(+)